MRNKRPKEFMHDKGHAGFRVFKIDPVSVWVVVSEL